MPLDRYVVADTHAAAYGEQLAVQPCVEAGGYDWPVPKQDLSEDTLEWINDAGRTLFNREIATEWGYHRPVTESDSTRAWQLFGEYVNSLNKDAEFNRLFEGCLASARTNNPLPDMDEQMFVYDLIAQSKHEALSRAELTDAAKRWQACLTNEGVDAPASPELMPTQQMRTDFGLEGGQGESTGGASEVEIQVALADVNCSETSGYTDIFYRSQYEAQTNLIADNAYRLNKIGLDVERFQVATERVISEMLR